MNRRLAVSLCILTAAAYGQQRHAEDVIHKGDHAMGFSHEKTTHHFRLTKAGGAIQVVANDPDDTATTDQIRHHLTHIAHEFSIGNFEIPMFIHDQVPPGASVMKKLRRDITYTFESLPLGGAVVIQTTNSRALQAVHDFLKFQIRDHRTGDPEAVM